MGCFVHPLDLRYTRVDDAPHQCPLGAVTWCAFVCADVQLASADDVIVF